MPKFPQKPNSVWYFTFSFNWSPWNLFCITGQTSLFPEQNVPKTEELVTWEELPFVVADRYVVSVIRTCKSEAGAAFSIVAGRGLHAYSLSLIHLPLSLCFSLSHRAHLCPKAQAPSFAPRRTAVWRWLCDSCITNERHKEHWPRTHFLVHGSTSTSPDLFVRECERSKT